MRNASARHLAETDPGDKYQPDYDALVTLDRVSDGAWVMCHAFSVERVSPLGMFDLVRFKRPDRLVRSYPTLIITRLEMRKDFETDLKGMEWMRRSDYEQMCRDMRTYRPFLVWGRASLIVKRIAEFCCKPFLGYPPTDQEKYLYWDKLGVWFWGEPIDMEWRAVSRLPLRQWHAQAIRDSFEGRVVTDRERILIWRRYGAWALGEPADMSYRPTPEEEDWIRSFKNCLPGY